MRIFLVSAFLPDITQQIHSLRASGVILPHTAFAALEEARAFRRSAGILCTTLLVIRLFYQTLYPTCRQAGFRPVGVYSYR